MDASGLKKIYKCPCRNRFNSSFLINGNTVSVKNDFVTVNLPSLGFIMKAEYIRKTSEDKPSILSAQSLQAGSNEKFDVNYQNTVVGK
jgi:hypothetical protein